MRRSIADVLSLLNRWPRRLAALACLLLAGASALTARGQAAARTGAAPSSPVVVSARALSVATMLTARDLAVARWPRDILPGNEFADPQRLIGRRLAGPLGAGEAVTTTRLVGADLALGLRPGEVAAPVSVPAEVASFVRSGDRVDVLAAPPADGLDATTAPRRPATTVAQDVPVLAVLPLPDSGGDAVAQLIIGTDRATALRVAALHGRTVLAVVANPP
ncbi:MAG: Conserved secreted protein of unknown function, putative domain [Pseudonocardiales bacterium]|nr:Conserved secreted protein of unknown function, putative domain [Pseudonocardiales bacterium]